MKIFLSEQQFRNLIETEELHELLLGKHNMKELKNFFSWLERRQNCKVSETKNGYVVCPPITVKLPCYSMHRSDKGIYDLERAVGKWFDVTRHVVEKAFKADITIVKPPSPDVEPDVEPEV